MSDPAIKVEGEAISLHRLTPAVSSEQMIENMRSSISRGLRLATACRPHDITISVAAGGPSLQDTYKELDGFIGAVNGSLGFLLDHEIKDGASYACAVMDAGDHIADALVADPNVRYYIASVVSPKVFDKLKDCDVRLWHITPESTTDPKGVEAVLHANYPDQWHAIGGGCTMGLRWINLGYYLGFRRFKLHGLDSSFRGSSTHAYPDRADTKDRVEFRGRQTRPNFLAQFHDFFAVVGDFNHRDPSVTFEVFGDGLLQDEWASWTAPVKGRFREVGGFLWPKSDRNAYVALRQVYQLESVIPLCNRKNTAVQAGGNVGVYAKYLARHFDRVISYEPDKDNFDCLVRNVPEANVEKIRAALGDMAGSAGMERDPINVGAHRIAGDGDIPVVRIDDRKLDACDFLCLDVEGYEMFALKGAAETIRKFRPVILFESNGLGRNFCVEPGDIQKWLVDEYGYKEVARHGNDVVMVC